jgi:predicted metal-dependent hydrolase
MAKALKRLRVHALPKPKLRLLRMLKRWGSCTEYVIIHGICHLKHPNHSAAFFHMLDAVLPDWRERKQRLERTEI